MKKTVFRSVSAVLIFMMLLGFMTKDAAGYSGIALDVEDHRVYQSMTALTLLTDFAADIKRAQSSYDGHYMVVYGTITSKTSDSKSFTLRDNGNSTGLRIKCGSSGAVSGLSGISIGETVRVFGKVEISTFWTEDISMDVGKIEKTGMTSVSSSLYMMANGSSFSRISMMSRNIEGEFSYKIPAGWKAVEYALPNVYGYQYKLNELTGEGIAESLFVFFVDDTMLKKPTDISNINRVRKAVVENILCNKNLKMYSEYMPLFDRDIEISKKSTDYASFTYYTGSYTEHNINRYNHRVEFAFIENGKKDGICAILYVYNNPEHIDEIHMMMRTMAE